VISKFLLDRLAYQRGHRRAAFGGDDPEAVK
jgi:hypothetical protein